MPERLESKAVERSCQLYRRFLILYPRPHREEYGAAILQLFRDQCRDAWSAAQLRGLLGFWVRALSDLLRTSVVEHLAHIKEVRFMLNSFRPRFKPLPLYLLISALVSLPIFLASVVVTFIYPETYASKAMIQVESKADGTDRRRDFNSDRKFQQMLIEPILSSAVLEKAAAKLNLADIWGKKYNDGRPVPRPDVEAMLRGLLDLHVVRNTRMVEIRAYGASPTEAAALANGVAEAYRDYRQEEIQKSGQVVPAARAVTIIAAAEPDPRPVRPNKPLNIVVGALAGMLVGLTFGAVALGIFASLRKQPEESAVPG